MTQPTTTRAQIENSKKWYALGVRNAMCAAMSCFSALRTICIDENEMLETIGVPQEPSGDDKNLLYGILAVQVDFVTREQLTDALKEWVSNKSRPLSEMLIKMDILSEDEHALLLPLVEQHIVNNGGDPSKSLATLSDSGFELDPWRTIVESQIDATLSVVANDKSGTAIDETMVAPTGPGKSNVSIHKRKSPQSDASMAGDRFRIVRPHAKGGLGEVSVAKDLELNRDVALKEIQSRFAHDEGSRSRFLLEAEVTGGLEHPGIVPVYGLGSYQDGRPFYAMRFIQGDSLQEAVDRLYSATPDSSPNFSSVAFRKLLGRFIDVCHAIEYAHSRGVLHRDLKPGNIMLGEYGETLVVDWGLAKMQSGSQSAQETAADQRLQPMSASGSSATMMGSAIGTPAYMPPEQAAGELDQLGAASDVYSLGATLYYMLTGRVAFQGNARSVLEDVKSGSFPKPREIRAAVPRQLEAICVKAMSQSQSDRYESPEMLANDVESFLADEPIPVYREPLLTRFRRWGRKHQTLVASSMAVVLVSIAGLAAFSSVVSGKNAALTELNGQLDSRNTELTEANTRAGAAAAAAKASEERERLERDRAEEALYLSDVRLAASNLQDRQHADAYTGLTNHLPQLSSTDRRGWEWYHLLGRAKVSLATWAASPVTVPSIDWSPDGSRLATCHWNETAAIIWSAKDGEQIQVVDDGTTLRNGIQWHPTKNQVAWGAAVDDALVRILDLDSNSLIKLEENVGSITSVRWSPDGERIAISSMNVAEYADAYTVVVWANQGGTWEVLSKTRIADCDGADAIRWSPDGEELMVVGRKAPTWILNPDSLEILRQTPFKSLTAASWHPTKPVLACGKANGEVTILDADSMKVTQSKRGVHLGDVSALAWSPDGRFLASGGSDHSLRVLSESLDPVSRYVGHRGTVNDITWHPDSTQLASCGTDGRVNTWPRSEAPESISLPVIKQFPRSWFGRAPSFSWLDTNTIRTQSTQNIIDVDASSGEILRTINAPKGAWRLLKGNLLIGRSEGFNGIESTRLNADPEAKPEQFPDAIVIWANAAENQIATTTVGHRSRLYVRDTRTNRDFTLGDEVMFTTMDVVWSKDDRQVISVGCGRMSDGGNLAYAGWIHLFNAETGDLISRARVGNERIRGNAGAWSSDSKLVAAASLNGTCQVYNVPELTTVWSKPIHRLQVNSLSWHPTEPRVASASKDRTVAVWDALTGEVYLRFSLPNTCAQVTWSPDGNRLATLDYGRKIRVWDSSTGYELVESGALTNDVAATFEQEAISSIIMGDLHAAWVSGKKTLELGGNLEWKIKYYVALAAIQEDDDLLYRRCVSDLLQEASETNDVEKKYLCLWVASLAPNSVSDYASMRRMARELVKAAPDEPRFQLGLAALMIRAGRANEAKRQLESKKALFGQDVTDQAYYHFLLSLSSRQSGNLKEALKQFKIANAFCIKALDARPNTDRKAILEILRAEANSVQ